MALEGKIILAFEPPDFKADAFSSHPDAEFVVEVLGKDQLVDVEEVIEECDSSESESSDVLPSSNSVKDLKGTQDNCGGGDDSFMASSNPFDALSENSS